MIDKTTYTKYNIKKTSMADISQRVKQLTESSQHRIVHLKNESLLCFTEEGDTVLLLE
ncbi:MAG: hypothetical protein H8D26_09285 [Methanomicrobia archaeon]|nr:hypothetical protein [Methanomicrobia archaeon]